MGVHIKKKYFSKTHVPHRKKIVKVQFTSFSTTLWNSDRIFARTFQYKVVRITKSSRKVLGVSFAQYLCTGFGNAYNFILERSSEYTVGVPQSSTKEGELYVYKLFFSLAHVMCFTEIILICIFSNYQSVRLLLIQLYMELL